VKPLANLWHASEITPGKWLRFPLSNDFGRFCCCPARAAEVAALQDAKREAASILKTEKTETTMKKSRQD